MKKFICITCYAVFICAAISARVGGGAASKAELQQLYQNYFQHKDEQKLATLVYWPGVERRERDAFFRALRNDLKHRLGKVGFVPLDAGVKLEYTLNGVTYVPSLPVIGRLIASYEDEANVKHLSTSYLVGTKGGRYYIALAVRKNRK